jgi:antitoxin YefM
MLCVLPMNKTYSYTGLRANLAAALDEASATLEPIVVERRGKAPVALIDAGELSSMMELVHLLRSPANAKRLFEALDDTKAGKGIEMTLEEFRARNWIGAKV